MHFHSPIKLLVAGTRRENLYILRINGDVLTWKTEILSTHQILETVGDSTMFQYVSIGLWNVTVWSGTAYERLALKIMTLKHWHIRRNYFTLQ